MFQDEESPASKWLWTWVEEHINSPGYREDKADFAKDVEFCLAQAKADGFDKADIVDAAGGDLAQFLMDRQNALTDAEVKRLADKDD